MENLRNKIEKAIPKKTFQLLLNIGRMADQEKINAFMVGGFVRDLLLGKKNLDMDIVVEGDALKFSRKLAERFKAGLVSYPRFGTSTIILKDKFKIDFAQARSEIYPYPAALPRVKFSHLRDDLYRRDFTINAMAIQINAASFGRMIDFFGGQEDLKARKIRILHRLSFIDDPTRIFRAVRFEKRYGFKIETQTEKLIKQAINQKLFAQTSKERLRNEICLILSEKKPEPAIERMNELDELRFIHPQLKWNLKKAKLFQKIRQQISWFAKNAPGQITLKQWLIYFAALVKDLPIRQIKKIGCAYRFSAEEQKKLTKMCGEYKKVLSGLSRTKLRPSQIYALLIPYGSEEIIFFLSQAKKRSAEIKLKKFITVYQRVKNCLGGHDLIKMGFTPGVQFKHILSRLLCANLDYGIDSKKAASDFLKKLLPAKRHKG
jgi:tRNA nucleotidyltransferase (CCA-adding enzyme)